VELGGVQFDLKVQMYNPVERFAADLALDIDGIAGD
jgi:hypothetical protein